VISTARTQAPAIIDLRARHSKGGTRHCIVAGKAEGLTGFRHRASLRQYVLSLRGFHKSANMNQRNAIHNGFKFIPNGRAFGRFAGAVFGAGLLCCGAVTICAAQTRPITPGAHDANASVSKFEARRIRHTCQERANERGVKSVEREAFLTRCFFGRSALRGARRDCAKQGAAKGLDKPALRDFVRECVKEQRAKQKLPE
jgi:hypothetical protein